VEVVVHRVTIVVHEIVSVVVVDEAVSVIIDAVTWGFSSVNGDITGEIGVCVFDSRINNSYRYSG
jgi:hypothetical protein